MIEPNKPSEFAMKAAFEINRAAVSNDDLFSERRLASIIDSQFKPLRESHEKLIADTEMLLLRMESESQRFSKSEIEKRMRTMSSAKKTLAYAQVLAKQMVR